MRFINEVVAQKLFPESYKKVMQEIAQGTVKEYYQIPDKIDFEVGDRVELSGKFAYPGQPADEKGVVTYYYLEDDTMFYVVDFPSQSEERALRAVDLKTSVSYIDPNPSIRWGKDPDLRIKSVQGSCMILIDDDDEEFEEPVDLTKEEWKALETKLGTN